MKQKFFLFVKGNTNFLFLIFLIILSIILQFFILGENLNNKIVLINTLDLSWQTDTIERFRHGYIAGQDFIFTYGPLHQIIYALPVLLFNQPSYIAVLYAPILLTFFNILLLFFILKLSIRDTKTCLIILTILFFIIDLLAYDQNTLFRLLLPFLYGLLLFRFTTIRKKINIKTVGILFLPAFFGLYTFDLFILGVLLTVIFVAYELYTLIKSNKITSQYILRGLYYFVVSLFFIILISLFLSGNLNYIKYSFDTVKNYQFVMNIPWSINQYSFLLFFPFGLCVILQYVLKTTRLTQDLKKVSVLLTLVALIQFKAALIRSDDGHIIMGIYPSLIVLCILLYFIFKEKAKLLFILLLIFFYLLIPIRNNYFSTFSLNNFYAATSLLTTSKSFSSIYELSPDYYFTQKDIEIFKPFILNNPNNVMVYPYDSYLLNIFNQTYNTVALQLYQYSNSLVEEKTVQELQKNPPKFIILGIDQKGAVALDSIPNFSRNPLLAKWMFENYNVEKKAKNYLILHFDQGKKIKLSKRACTVYEIDTKNIMQTDTIERLSKSSTYYLTSGVNLRLPYMPNTNEVLLLEKFNDPIAISELFENSIEFNKYYLQRKQISIIKKYPFPFIEQKFKDKVLVKCFN